MLRYCIKMSSSVGACSIQLHCKENTIYVFPEIKLHGLLHNFHIHVSYESLTVYMNVGIGNEAALFSFLGIHEPNFWYSVFALCIYIYARAKRGFLRGVRRTISIRAVPLLHPFLFSTYTLLLNSS